MFITYWLIDSRGAVVTDADSIGDLKGILGDLQAGRYTVDEIPRILHLPAIPRGAGESFSSASDGSIVEEPDR